MKFGIFQKILLFIAVVCFGGFLYSYANAFDWAELVCATAMGVSFLMILAWGEISMEERNPSSDDEDFEEEERTPETHMDSLLEQLADRRRRLDEAEERLTNAESELEHTNEVLRSVEQEAEHFKSEAEALRQANESLNDQISKLKEEAEENEKTGEIFSAESILPAVGDATMQVLPIAEAARKAADEFEDEAKKAGIQIRVVAPEKPLMVYADPKMLNILFKNIIDNAVKYMGSQGTMQITISEIGEELFIVMKDNGAGLSKKETEHIFELNYQGSNRISGNGLGLAQARAIVGHFGGMIYARSDQGRGMGVYIHLPASVK